MRIEDTELDAVKLLVPRRHGDARGWLAETWHAARFDAAGVRESFVQENQSLSRGPVLRGLHYQLRQAQGGDQGDRQVGGALDAQPAELVAGWSAAGLGRDGGHRYRDEAFQGALVSDRQVDERRPLRCLFAPGCRRGVVTVGREGRGRHGAGRWPWRTGGESLSVVQQCDAYAGVRVIDHLLGDEDLRLVAAGEDPGITQAEQHRLDQARQGCGLVGFHPEEQAHCGCPIRRLGTDVRRCTFACIDVCSRLPEMPLCTVLFAAERYAGQGLLPLLLSVSAPLTQCASRKRH
jgi:hypothetical protein